MILFPAIDLKDGQCVRLLYGDMDKATVFNDDPAALQASAKSSSAEAGSPTEDAAGTPETTDAPSSAKDPQP